MSRYCVSLLPVFTGSGEKKVKLMKIPLSNGAVIGFDDCGNAFILP